MKRKNLLGLCLLLMSALLPVSLSLIPLGADRLVQAAFLKDFKADSAILYFGSTQCGYACPLALARLAHHYDDGSLPPSTPLIFISLEQEGSDQQSRAYAQAFHPQFFGFSLTGKAAEQIQSDVGVKFEEVNPTDPTHDDYYYLLQKGPEGWKLILRQRAQQQSLAALLNKIAAITNK